MTKHIDETLCPFCNAPNNCMAQSAKPCWCMTIEVPEELQELVPKEKKRKACICQNCIATFKKDPELFRRKLHR